MLPNMPMGDNRHGLFFTLHELSYVNPLITDGVPDLRLDMWI